MRPLGLALVVVLGIAAAAGAQERVGAVASLEGQAQARHRGAPEDVALAAGADVLLGDRLRTLADSRLKVLLRDESVLTLAADSELTVDEQSVGAAPTSALSLAAGAVRAVVSPGYRASGARFEVETPTAVAGVRGTTFQVTYDATGEVTEVLGVEGIVLVRARADAGGRRAVRIGPNQLTRVPRHGFPTKPRTLSRTQVLELLTLTGTQSGGRRPEAEFGLPGGGPPKPSATGAVTDPRRPDAPGMGNISPESGALDQPVQQLRDRLQPGPPSPPPGPPAGKSR